MFEFGSILLVPLPFTSLRGVKRRPALLVSTDNDQRPDVVLSFITSVETPSPWSAVIEPDKTNGLKARSWVRFDKIATLEKGIVVGKLGEADRTFLAENAGRFHAVFGFQRQP